MSDPLPADRLRVAVPLAVAIIRGIESAATDDRRALDAAMTAALADGEDTEALVLALANMAHALVATLARQTGTPVERLIASIGQVGGPDEQAGTR